jgi:hypothetical protein
MFHSEPLVRESEHDSEYDSEHDSENDLPARRRLLSSHRASEKEAMANEMIQRYLPDVTVPATLTLNVVHDAVHPSILTWGRVISRDRARQMKNAAQSMQSRSYAPGLAESPPESVPLELIYFEPEVQDMSSHDQQMAAEHALVVPEPEVDTLDEDMDLEDEHEPLIVNLRNTLSSSRVASLSEPVTDVAPGECGRNSINAPLLSATGSHDGPARSYSAPAEQHH